LVVVAGLFIAEHDSPNVIGDPPLAAAHGFPGGLALGEFAPEVVVAGPARGADLDQGDLDQGDDVQGMVALPVTSPGQPVPSALAAGHLDGSGAGVAGQVRRGGEPRRPSGAAEQPAGDDRADANGLGQPAAQGRDRVLDPVADGGQPAIQPPDLSDQVPGDLLAGTVAGGQGVDRAQQRGGPVGAQLAWSATSDELAQHGMELVDAGVGWPTRLLRRSSNTASTTVASSGWSGSASPCNAATAAAAAASRASVLRPGPRDSSRTRAVAVVGTSWTVSP
jgi:hypothetical protein